MTKLKLFIWHEVFCDYTCGIAFAIAETKEEAITLITKEQEYNKNELEQKEPEVHPIDKKYGCMIWGGG